MAENLTLTKTYTPTRALRSAKASACGKTIIVGEHAVVYGARAVAMPLRTMRMQVELQPTTSSDCGQSISLRLGDKEVSNRIGGVVTDALKLLSAKPFSLAIHGKSSLPFGAGLGSSATLCIVVLKVLAQGLGINLSPDELADLGNVLERRFHGSPSGLDTAVVAFEECILFAKGEEVATVPVPTTDEKRPFWHFALIDSGVRASTLAMINLAAPFFKGSAGEQRIALFDTIAETTVRGLASHDLALVSETMSECGKLLAGCGVVTPKLQEIIVRALELGTLAAKPTGAGGGGAILTLLDQAGAAEQLARLQNEFGADKVFAVSL